MKHIWKIRQGMMKPAHFRLLLRLQRCRNVAGVFLVRGERWYQVRAVQKGREGG